MKREGGMLIVIVTFWFAPIAAAIGGSLTPFSVHLSALLACVCGATYLLGWAIIAGKVIARSYP